jgi:hypothetical protein
MVHEQVTSGQQKGHPFLKFQDSSLTEEVKLKLDMVRESAAIYNKYKGP